MYWFLIRALGRMSSILLKTTEQKNTNTKKIDAIVWSHICVMFCNKISGLKLKIDSIGQRIDDSTHLPIKETLHGSCSNLCSEKKGPGKVW